MDTKLTLSIDKKVIERAKIYSIKERRSLSDIIENYLKLLTNEIRRSEETGVMEERGQYSTIEKWRGAFHLDVPEGFDYKEILTEELWKKHMK